VNSVAVNNAGYVVGVDKVGDLSLDNMEGMFATNVFGLIALTQLFIKGE
jgi:3-hydroxy acid dehydrogenase/malonic semialdehyde reductase